MAPGLGVTSTPVPALSGRSRPPLGTPATAPGAGGFSSPLSAYQVPPAESVRATTGEAVMSLVKV